MTPPHFCEYLPFEKDLALDLYNFKFPLPKDLSDLNEILYNEQLEDGEYRGDNYFSKFLCHALN